jgi:PKHD-type hydroxylase
MLLNIPAVLSAPQITDFLRLLSTSAWVDGRVTAGHQCAIAKRNSQLPEDHRVARQLGDEILSALDRNSLFMSAALPLKVFPPLFNRYEVGESFGTHVDNAIRQVTGTSHRVRTDLSATLFLTDPEKYDGGELLVEDTFGVHSVKLPAGHLILYPSSSLHQVQPITRGVRISAFFWIQSMVRDDAERTMLFDLDSAIQRLRCDFPDHPSGIQLTGTYHNLLRRWADL